MEGPPPLQDVEAWGIAGLTTNIASKYFQQAAGTVQSEVLTSKHNGKDAYIQAAIEAGFSLTEPATTSVPIPSNAAFEFSVAHDPLTGKRHDLATVHLTPALEGDCASTLTLSQSAAVSKVVIESGKAIAVEYMDTEDQTTTFIVGARKEVILPFILPKFYNFGGLVLARYWKIQGLCWSRTYQWAQTSWVGLLARL